MLVVSLHIPDAGIFMLIISLSNANGSECIELPSIRASGFVFLHFSVERSFKYFMENKAICGLFLYSIAKMFKETQAWEAKIPRSNASWRTLAKQPIQQ